MADVTDSDTPASLLNHEINYVRKKFSDTGDSDRHFTCLGQLGGLDTDRIISIC